MCDPQWNGKPLEYATACQDSRLLPGASQWSHQYNFSPTQMPSTSQPDIVSSCTDLSIECKTSPVQKTNYSSECVSKLAKNSRYWENISHGKFYGKKYSNKNGLPFVVVSYNILAQILLENHRYLYKHCPVEAALEWDYRFKHIKTEIISLNPDLICLQEVQVTHLNEIRTIFSKLGFESTFKQKTGIREDGCAIFYKKALFDFVDHHSVEFFQPGINLLNRDNIGLMVKLRLKSDPNSQLVICTTHLLYNPRRSDVRLAQIKVFLAEIDRFSYVKRENNKYIHLPIILTGDFNSLPNSPVSSLVADGNYKYESFFTDLYSIAVTDACQHLGVYICRNNNDPSHDFALSKLSHSEYRGNRISIQRQNAKHNHLFNNMFTRHILNFKSVYNHVKTNGENEASTFQNEWVIVDYIYFSRGSFKTLDARKRFRLPTVAECANVGPIPNTHYGSDHLCLAAQFVMYSTNKSTL